MDYLRHMDKKIISGNRRGASTKVRLLDVAEELIAARGVEGVSTREIAAAAGQANHSTVRHHFQSKEDLIRAVLVDRAGEIEAEREALIATMSQPLSPTDAIVALVRPLAAHMAAHGNASHYFRFVEQTSRHFGFIRVAEEARNAPSLMQCMEVLTGPAPLDRERAAKAYLVSGLIWRGFADREQARAEGMLVIEDDDTFAKLLIATAISALVAEG
jgi:AcrR family transcriptional regulator